MKIKIRINKKIYIDAKKVAKTEKRTTASQIEYWAKIGKCALDNPDLPVEFIRELLVTSYFDRSSAEPFHFTSLYLNTSLP